MVHVDQESGQDQSPEVKFQVKVEAGNKVKNQASKSLVSNKCPTNQDQGDSRITNPSPYDIEPLTLLSLIFSKHLESLTSPFSTQLLLKQSSTPST